MTRTSESQQSSEELLAASNDMEPVAGVVEVDIPIDTLWECFTQANLWPRWNPCFFWGYNRDLILGKQLIWAFQPIRWWYLYKMPAIAKIVEVEPQKKVTWEVTALPGFYARHTYHMEDLGNGKSRFGSWEKATGWSFRLMKWFWIPHFVFVKDRSLEGAEALEKIYQQQGAITSETIPRKNYVAFLLSLLLIIALFAGGIFGGWFYTSYVHQTAISLAPGVDAVLDGGGNSLVIQGDQGALLVDTKFFPGSKTLKKWIDNHVDVPVTQIVDTHFHYDHTQGNILYPDAQIIAHQNVPKLMQLRDSSWWSENPTGIPTKDNLISQKKTLTVGKHKVVLTHPGVAHTEGDLVVYLPQENIVATGDLLFHTYYPFFDLGQGGVSIPDMIKAIRKLAQEYPDANFMPGHGSMAQAEDLTHYADYLDFLYQSVQDAYKKGLSEEETVKQIDLSSWNLSILPSFHEGKLLWATANNNIRWVYQMLSQQ